MTIVLCLAVCLNASGSPRGLGLLGEVNIVNSNISGSKKQSRDLEAVEKQHLWESLKANPPYYSIDVSYAKKTVVPADIFQKRLEKLKQRAQEMEKNHQQRWRNLEVRTQGFVNPANEHVILSRERVRIERLKKVRTDITFFAGDSESSPKTREIVNLYHDGTFYFINKTEQRIEIYDKPQFRGSSGSPMLHAGKIAGYLGITLDIVVAVDPNSVKRVKDGTKKKYKYAGGVTVNGKLTEHIECVNTDNEKKEYDLFLDPNNWGLCHKISWNDKDTGHISKTSEFRDFSLLKQTNDLYPHTIIQRKFGEEGKEKERQETKVSRVVTGLPIPDEILDIKVREFADFEIIDYRFSPPLKTFNHIKKNLE